MSVKALITYDNDSCATNANAVLHRTTHRTKGAVKWDASLWRVEMLKSPPTAGRALRDAADAHLILFAVRHLPRLHGWLVEWLEQWVSNRQIPDAALAIIGDGTAEARVAAATVEMSRFARQNGLSFIFNSHGEISDKSGFLTPAGNQTMSSMPPPPPSFRRPATGVRDFGWGIND